MHPRNPVAPSVRKSRFGRQLDRSRTEAHRCSYSSLYYLVDRDLVQMSEPVFSLEEPGEARLEALDSVRGHVDFGRFPIHHLTDQLSGHGT